MLRLNVLVSRLFAFSVYLLFFDNYVTTNAEECLSSSKQIHSKLKQDLLCDYEKDIRPRLDKDQPIIVETKMVVTHYDYMMHSYTLSVNCWLYLKWEDDHLRWKPEDYESVTTFKFSTDEIWTPHLSLYNSVDNSGETNLIQRQDCKVKYDGKVVCVVSANLNSYCLPNLKNFPYDVQRCSMSMGAWADIGEEVNYTFAGNGTINLKQTYKNPEWTIVSVKPIRHELKFNKTTYPILEVLFVVKRHPTTVAAITVVPCLLLLVLTLVTLLLRAEESDRLILSLTNILIHILQATNVMWQIPDGGDETPLIITYTRDSLLMATTALVLTVLERKLIRNVDVDGSSITNWMRKTVGLLLNNKVGQIVFLFEINPRQNNFVGLEDDGNSIVENDKDDDPTTTTITTKRITNKNKDVSQLFTQIIDRTFFFIFFLVYIILIFNYLAQ